MGKYESFNEYMVTNYSDIISNKLNDFILNNLDKIVLQYDNKKYIDVNIEFVEILCIDYTKSELDYVEFDCMVYPNYYLVSYENGYKVKYRGLDQSFVVSFKGTFRQGFTVKSVNVGLSNDVKCEKITSGLVPIVRKEEMEDYATKFLQYYCPEALHTPMQIDVNKILYSNGIEWYLAPLPHDVHGKTYFADDEVEIYNHDKIIKKKINRGTILINQEKLYERTIGSVRNTIIHEVVHWFFHNNYFELRHLLNNEETCAVCYKSDNQIYSDEVKWMEIQARSLTPKILMPKDMFLLKFEELYKESVKVFKNSDYEDYKNVDILQMTIHGLADFFNVSKQTVKYRLLDLGYMEADGILNYNENSKSYIRSYSFEPSKLQKYQTFFVSKKSYNNLISKDITISNLVNTKKLLYIGGLLVLNHPKYVKGRKLTDYAIDHVDECCVIINTKSETKPFESDVAKFTLYCSNSTKVEAQIDYKQTENLLIVASEDYDDFNKNKHNLPSSFGDTIEYHCLKNGMSYEWVVLQCDLTAVTIRNYRYEEVDNINPVHLIKFCLGLKLSYPYIQDLLNKAGISLSRLTKINALYATIITSYSKIGLTNIYHMLKPIHQEDILKLTKKYKEKHNLI